MITLLQKFMRPDPLVPAVHKARTKVRSVELIGEALNWAVALALGYSETKAPHLYVAPFGPLFGRDADLGVAIVGHKRVRPSTDWGQGGPILERFDIRLRGIVGGFCARIPGSGHRATGRTQLIASMRCIVLAKLGEEVEVPTSLLLKGGAA